LSPELAAYFRRAVLVSGGADRCRYMPSTPGGTAGSGARRPSATRFASPCRCTAMTACPASWYAVRRSCPASSRSSTPSTARRAATSAPASASLSPPHRLSRSVHRPSLSPQCAVTPRPLPGIGAGVPPVWQGNVHFSSAPRPARCFSRIRSWSRVTFLASFSPSKCAHGACFDRVNVDRVARYSPGFYRHAGIRLSAPRRRDPAHRPVCSLASHPGNPPGAHVGSPAHSPRGIVKLGAAICSIIYEDALSSTLALRDCSRRIAERVGQAVKEGAWDFYHVGVVRRHAKSRPRP